MDKKIIIVFGAPGSGKGTQADMLAEELKLPVISPGELLRNERDQGSRIGKQAADLMAKGKMVGEEIVEKLLSKRMKQEDAQEGYILDGYPRYQVQANNLMEGLKKEETDYQFITIFIDASDKAIIKRIAGRRVCNCGAAYHLNTNPPKRKGICDKCAKKLYQRNDDKPQVVKNRLFFYHRQTEPVIDFFRKHSEFIQVDGDQTIDEVKLEINKKLKSLF